jgi:enoyl-[acyl-carrier protein] reductase II
MKTRVTELLGIEKPIIQGAMARIADARLAAAVSNGGGLGIIATGGEPLEWVREQIELARTLTDRPFGVNVMLMDPQAPDVAALCCEMKVAAVTTGAGSPSNYIEAWHEAGVKVLPVVASSALARRMERCGADAVIAEGCESGGHIGEITTMALVPAVCDTVAIPVIAAGGIADGRGMTAAFALGAEGVQVGTRFLTATECKVAEAYKQKVIAAKDGDTIVTGRDSGHAVRQLKNKWARAVRAAEKKKDDDADNVELKLAGSLARAVEGDVEGGSMMSGQVACLVHQEQPAAEILDEMMREFESWASCPLEERVERNAQRTWRG